MIEAPRKTQKQRLLEILERGPISNYELRSLQPPVFQYPVRLMELKEEGHPIIGYHDETDRRKYWYRLVRSQTDLFT